MEKSLDDFFTIPNFITLVGIWFASLYIWGIFADYDENILIVFLYFTAMSDVLDGFLARRLNQETRIGMSLDKIRDKFLLAAVLLSFCAAPIEDFSFCLLVIFLIICFELIRINVFERGDFDSFLNRFYGKSRQIGYVLCAALRFSGAISAEAGVFLLLVSSLCGLHGAVIARLKTKEV